MALAAASGPERVEGVVQGSLRGRRHLDVAVDQRAVLQHAAAQDTEGVTDVVAYPVQAGQQG